jgi:hypothetical protein
MEAGCLKYSYNLNAWYYHSQFELIERATPDSLQQVCELINAEYSEDYEDEDDFDYHEDDEEEIDITLNDSDEYEKEGE